MEIPKEFAARFPDFLPVSGKNDRLSGQGEARRGVALPNATPRFRLLKSQIILLNKNPFCTPGVYWGAKLLVAPQVYARRACAPVRTHGACLPKSPRLLGR